jgi:thioredoxin-dependent peroxiredoxin
MRALMTMGLMTALGVATMMAQGAPAAAPQGGPAPAPAVPTVVKVGDMAPDFSLQGTDGKTHKLSEYRGKTNVVVAWFPKAFTQGCTIECKSLAENGDKIKKYDVAYFMASVDNIEDNTAFAKATSVTLQGRNGQPTGTVVEKKEADFPMLADPTKETAMKYGVLNAAGVANRWTFYINKQGRITAIETAVRPATSAEDMIAKLDELKIAKKG